MCKSYDIESFRKRAKVKFVQKEVIWALKNLGSPLSSKYEDTEFCSTYIQQNGNKFQSRYCNHRWCRICNRIRTAKLIKGYQPTLDKMKEKVFLTLTIPNVPADQLRSSIKQMNKTIKLIQDNRRKKKLKVIRGIRKIECTYNVDRNDYHPHFHFILDSFNVANEVLQEWLIRYPQADIQGQDIREADNPKELFKYFTKLTSKSKSDRYINIKKKKKREEYHYIEAIDTIFQAITNIRVIQTMGDIKMISEDIEKIEVQQIDTIEKANDLWYYSHHDWVNVYTGELLTGYNPSAHIKSYSKKIRYLHKEKNTS